MKSLEMKLAVLCVGAVVAAMASAMDDAAYDREIGSLVTTKSPGRWISAINPDVVRPLVEDWIRTNAPVNRVQELTAARWRMALDGANRQWDGFERNYAVIRAETNVAARVAQYEQLIRWVDGLRPSTHADFRIGAREAVERLLAGSAGDFPAPRRMQLHELVAVKGVAVFLDRAKSGWDRHFEAVKGMADEPPFRARALGGMINGLFPLGREEARREYERNRALLGEPEETAFLLAYAAACAKANDRDGFDRAVETIRAFAPGRKALPYADILGQMSAFDMKTARKLLAEALEDPDLTPESRGVYLEARMKFYQPVAFVYGQNEPGLYEMWKKSLLERMALPWFPDRYYDAYAATAMDFEDYAFAGLLLEKGLEKNPASAAMLMKRARLHVIERGDRASAADDYAAAANGAGFEGGSDAALCADVAAYLRTKATPSDSLPAMRRLSRELYRMRLYDECRALQAQWMRDLLVPAEAKTHSAVFDEDAPRSAEGFVRSKYYGDWKGMETRFEKFGADYHMRANYDEKLLKKSPDLTPDPKYPTGIRVIADNDFVHIFMRCDDPAIEDVKTGKRTDAGSLELFFEPGDHEVPYHSIFLENLPATEDDADVIWAMPDRHYRRTTDFVTKDAVLTKEGVVAHVAIPWTACYDTLPFDGRHWLLGVFRWHPGGGQCIGGYVHALSRGLRLEFPFPPERVAAIRKRVAETAYNRYAAVRDAKDGYIQRWNDELLGDPAFFAAEVKPLLEELDAKGKAPEAKDTADWAEIGFEISSRRTRYLKRRLLSDSDK